MRDGHLEGPESMSNQQGYRPRTDSNVSLPGESGRNSRTQPPSNPEESRGRGASMSSSPNRMYRDDNRPRSGHSNSATSRDKLYYSATDYQPPQFPQNPYRHSVAIESQDANRRNSRPNSRTQSPIPPYPSTPPQHRYDALNPEQSRPRGNINRQLQNEQDQRTSEHPYQLAPLKFSSQSRGQESSYKLLVGTPFDDIANSPENEQAKVSPPAPRRPPPLPPGRQNNHTNVDQSRTSVYNTTSSAKKERSLSSHETDMPVRNPSNRDGIDEEWPLENVIEFLRQNGFGRSRCD